MTDYNLSDSMGIAHQELVESDGMNSKKIDEVDQVINNHGDYCDCSSKINFWETLLIRRV